MSQVYSSSSLALAAKSAETKFSPRDIALAVETLAYAHPEIKGPYTLAFYDGDDSVVARATIHRCTCAKYRESLSVVCAHRLACMLFARARGIDREMKTVYPKVIEQMVSLMSDPFAIEHAIAVRLFARPDATFLMVIAGGEYGSPVETYLSAHCRKSGSGLGEICREVFDNYQVLVERYGPNFIRYTSKSSTPAGMVVNPADNRLSALRAKNDSETNCHPYCPICHGAGVVNDMVDYGSTVVSMPSACECVCDEEDLHETD